jgi:PIN domain nuclease of toxin-antitoxin system
VPGHWKRWFRQAVQENGRQVLSISADVVEGAYSLPGDFHADPADRILSRRPGLKNRSY